MRISKICELKDKILELDDMIRTNMNEIISKCLVCGRLTYGNNYIWTDGYHLCSEHCQELFYRLNGPNDLEFTEFSHYLNKLRDKKRLIEKERMIEKYGDYETSDLSKHFNK